MFLRISPEEQCNENGHNELFFVDKVGPFSEDFGNGVLSEGLLLQYFILIVLVSLENWIS